jgi:hypothetical protein
MVELGAVSVTVTVTTGEVHPVVTVDVTVESEVLVAVVRVSVAVVRVGVAVVRVGAAVVRVGVIEDHPPADGEGLGFNSIFPPPTLTIGDHPSEPITMVPPPTDTEGRFPEGM